MSANTNIEWTDRTWNPVRGCSIVSPGCVNCYAMKQAHRFSGPGKAYEGLTKQTKAGPQWTGKVRVVEDALLEPLSWRKSSRVFVNSMSDLFHEGVPYTFVDAVFHVMQQAERHTFQILTKRADRMLAYVRGMSDLNPWQRGARVLRSEGFPTRASEVGGDGFPWPLPNVWLGVSVEDQQRADERIPHLLETPAAVHFISAEPLLGPIDLWARGWFVDGPEGQPLDWVIVGGESGQGARPCDLAWLRSIVEQCRAAGVSPFVKQLGARSLEVIERRPEDPKHVEGWTAIRDNRGDGKAKWYRYLSTRDRKGGDINEFPPYLRVREFPRVAVPA